MTTEQELIDLRDMAQALARELEALAERADAWQRDRLKIARGEALALADDLDQLIRPVSARFLPGAYPKVQGLPPSR